MFCAEGDVRIVNGPTVNVGLVEVCVNEEWGTICDDNWDSLDAGIVCAQRGFSRLSKYTINVLYMKNAVHQLLYSRTCLHGIAKLFVQES